MKCYALDANIISYIINRRLDIHRKIRSAALEDAYFVIPPVAYYEVLRGLLAKDATAKIRVFQRICREYEVGEMRKNTWEIASEIYAHLSKEGKLIEDADIMIAAFCIEHDFILVTNNVKHFQRIPELSYENWATRTKGES